MPPFEYDAGFVPTIVAGVGAGTGPSAVITGTDAAGLIQLNTGTTPAGGVLVVVTFKLQKPTTPQSVVFSPVNQAAANLLGNTFLASVLFSGFSISSSSAPGASASYFWYYHVDEV